ncbi:MAG: hypothetical protein AAF708_03105 [Deinococcota bacterium]
MAKRRQLKSKHNSKHNSKHPNAKAGTSTSQQVSERTFEAGCKRQMTVTTELSELAYNELSYPECPSCPHRVEPEDAVPFCVWRDVNEPHPFAGLAGMLNSLDKPDK